MQTTISVPDALLAAADERAARLAMSRSELFTRALTEYLAIHSPDGMTVRLDEVHATESGDLDPAIRRARGRSLDAEKS